MPICLQKRSSKPGAQRTHGAFRRRQHGQTPRFAHGRRSAGMAELVGHDARITTLQAARREVFPHVSDYTALDRWPDCGQRRAWQTCKRSRHLPLRQATHFVEIRKQLFHQRKKTARLGRGHESPPVRSNNGNPNCSSACLSVRLTAGWVMLIKRAAPLKLPVTITALKTSMWRRRIDGRPLNFPRCRAPAAPWPCGIRHRLRGLHCPACGTLRANTCCV